MMRIAGLSAGFMAVVVLVLAGGAGATAGEIAARAAADEAGPAVNAPPSAAACQTIPITATGLPAGVAAVRYDFGEAGCDGLPATATVGCSFAPCTFPTTFAYATQGAKTIRLTDPSGATEYARASITITAPGVAPGPPALVSPSNGATGVVPPNVQLSWSAPATGTAPFTYDVRMGPDAAHLAIACYGVTTTSCTATGIPENTSRVWTVTARTPFGSATSAAWSFTTGADTRPVVADFTWFPTPPFPGQPTTFMAATGADAGDPTSFSWTFADGGTALGATVSHVFSCSRLTDVTLTAARGTVSDSVTRSVAVTGTACAPEAVMALDAALVPGVGGTFWRTDLSLFNGSEKPTSVTMYALPTDRDNAGRTLSAGPFVIAPHATMFEANVIDMLRQAGGGEYQKASILLEYANDDEVAPTVGARTYTDAAGGGTYGQSSPGVEVRRGTTPDELWLTGMRDDGTTTGFRTNLAFTNLRATAAEGLQLTAFNAAGAQIGRATLALPGYGVRQASARALLGGQVEGIGPFSVKLGLPEGVDVEAYASVVDNQTGDPTLVPAVETSRYELVVPSVAHTNGVNGTVWRSAAYVTNTADDETRVWTFTFVPRGSAARPSRVVTLGPNQTLAISAELDGGQDLVSWLYGEDILTEVQGTLVVTPADGLRGMPRLVVRTYNELPAGTFGQAIPALNRFRAPNAGGSKTRLLLTGLSTEDIARTNLGFVSLGGPAAFAVSFYDEAGTLLNPGGAPYAVRLGADGWEQLKLESRWRGAGWPVPVNRRISVVAEVTEGAGYAYASVIDNQTGDPVFVAPQLAP